MLTRRIGIAALLAAVLASVGCSCCRHARAVNYGPAPCCGAPVAAPVAVPAAPAPVTAGFAPAAPCPTCVGR